MFIKAILSDGNNVTVSQEALDRLLEHNRVRCFERRSGWVVVDEQPIRMTGNNHNGSNGFKRRHSDMHH